MLKIVLEEHVNGVQSRGIMLIIKTRSLATQRGRSIFLTASIFAGDVTKLSTAEQKVDNG